MINENMRIKMLISELRHELSTKANISVEKVRIIGTRIEVVYSAKFNRGIKIHEGYLGGNIIPILTCKDEKLETEISEFIEKYEKCVIDCIKHSVKIKVGLTWF